jgi:hypothetical protein
MFFDPDKNKIYMTNTMLYRSTNILQMQSL